MSACPVCHAEETREALVDEDFHVQGEYVLVEGIPAQVRIRCGEQSFSREAAEKVRLMVNRDAKAAKFVPMRTLSYA